MTRRDVMRFFGVGAVVAPVALTAAPVEARILEPPKVELIEPQLESASDVLGGMMRDPSRLEVTVRLRDIRGGPAYELQAEGFLSKVERETIEVTSHAAGFYRQYLPGVMNMTFQVSGIHPTCRVIAGSALGRDSVR